MKKRKRYICGVQGCLTAPETGVIGGRGFLVLWWILVLWEKVLMWQHFSQRHQRDNTTIPSALRRKENGRQGWRLFDSFVITGNKFRIVKAFNKQKIIFFSLHKFDLFHTHYFCFCRILDKLLSILSCCIVYNRQVPKIGNEKKFNKN